MTIPLDLPPGRAVLVSDFDGTLARPDFYHLVRERLVPAGTPNYWHDYRAGRITHFDALKSFFEAAEGGEPALVDIIRAMEMPDDLPVHLDRLHEAGWEVVIVSAGCCWYIDRLLERAGARVPVLANPGRIAGGRLIMERPAEPAFYSFENGVDKAAVVQALQNDGRVVAFAGDGLTDLAPARCVAEQRRFARGDLAGACREQGLVFQPFERWTEVVDSLVRQAVG